MSSLQQVQGSVNQQLVNLVQLSTQLSKDYRLSKYMLTHPYYGKEVASEISRYKLSSPLINEIYITFAENPELYYSSVGHLSRDNFLKARFNRQADRLKVFDEQLAQRQPTLAAVAAQQPKQEPTQATFVVPVKNSEGTRYASVIYTITMPDLQHFIAQMVDSQTSNVVLYDQRYGLLTAANRTLQEDVGTGALLTAGRAGKRGTFKSETTAYALRTFQDDDFGLTFIGVTNADLLTAPVRSMQWKMLAVSLLMVSLGFLLAYVISNWQYSPIQKLERVIKSQLGQEYQQKQSPFTALETNLANFFARMSDS